MNSYLSTSNVLIQLQSFGLDHISIMVSISAVLGILFNLCVCCVARRTWNFEIISTNIISSNESLLTGSLQVDRISFSESSMSGFVDFKYDVYDTTMFELFVSSSVSGRKEDYHELPYKMPKLTISQFIDEYYEGVIYANFGNCSNLEKVEGKFVPPLPKERYVLKDCRLTGAGFPDILPIGYYHILLQISGPVNVDIFVIIKLTPKLV